MFTDKARDYIARGKAATFLLCENISGYMEKTAKENAPWTDRTSHARQSINHRTTRAGDTTTMSVAHGVKYGKYLEKGTPAHIIRPKPESGKKALFWHGAEHPVKLVHHPGTKAYPAILPAAEAGKKKLKEALKTLWEGGL